MIDEVHDHLRARVGANVRFMREELGWSLARLGEELRARTGRDAKPMTLSRLERGERRIDVDELADLALVLQVPMRVLLDGAEIAERDAEGILAIWRRCRHELDEAEHQVSRARSRLDGAWGQVVRLAALSTVAYERIEAEILEGTITRRRFDEEVAEARTRLHLGDPSGDPEG